MLQSVFSASPPKMTLENLLKDGQVVTGRDLIRRKKEKVRELALFQEALEFERRNRKSQVVTKGNQSF